jgi:hypothetical protein
LRFRGSQVFKNDACFHRAARTLEFLSQPRPFPRGLPDSALPAISQSEKVRFNQISKKTGHRIHLEKVDAETGKPVEADDIVKGYKTSGDYVENKDEDLRGARESTRSIDIDQFVPREEIRWRRPAAGLLRDCVLNSPKASG